MQHAQLRPRVLIADDHAVWRLGLRTMLEPTCDVVSEATEGDDALKKAIDLRPDVVLMDISMPGLGGIAATRRIKELLPTTGVVMVSASDDNRDIFECIQAGVSSYVVKDDAPEAILEAVHNAGQGKMYLPPAIAKRILERVASRPSPKAIDFGFSPSRLTPRETVVVRLMAQGLKNKEIGRELSISERTVGNHIGNIYNKLGIYDRAQATLFAIKEGIIRL